MALPKEPRQKMINMMYLVLTALLALNVSSEILNAFKTVNTSLGNSNIIIDKANTGISESMKEMLKDPNTRERAAIWGPKADSALLLTREVSEYISELKQKLIEGSGLKDDGTYKESNLDAASRIFETDGEGQKLFERLKKYKEDVLGILPANLASSIDSILPIDLSMPPTQNKGNNTWSAAYFRMTPTIAAVTMLNKFDNDVKRTGNMVANKCMEQVGKVVLRLDKFEPLVSQNTEYTLPGMPIKITAGLGAFSTQNLPTVTINGSPRPVDPASGAATWETTASGGGEQSVRVNITFKDPNTGETKTAEKTVSTLWGSQAVLLFSLKG
jgi:gliding motility-associated protein GldM